MTFRVLVIEDELIAGEANAAYATRAGLEVVGVVRSGREALRLLSETQDVDLLLLDMQLPDGHGLELLRRIRAAGAEVDVIAVTAARDIDIVRSAVAQGVVSYLIKPSRSRRSAARSRTTGTTAPSCRSRPVTSARWRWTR